jgi:hypothetical protein
MSKYNRRCEIRLTEAEFQTLSQKAKKAGVSVSAFLRQLIADCTIREAPPADVPRLMCEVKRVGNNINQILAIAYARGFLDAPKLRVALEELKAVDQLIFDTYTGDG